MWARGPVKSAWEPGVESKCISRTAVSIVVNGRTNGESLGKQMLGLLVAVKHPRNRVDVNDLGSPAIRRRGGRAGSVGATQLHEIAARASLKREISFSMSVI